ncbi:methyl-accepting chemotaxis protein [Paenibacillus turpanensis]|uniref:methyl-accepting chemotaxis protein n=1 Tax=Paenibacillus turpanensis TaxID=2689078 RepID=UPI00140A1CA1|nr:methyl-accepting chemotaxis protein [Paenibacillus turpanensis]
MNNMNTLTGKFLLITGIVLLLLFSALFAYRYQAISGPIEEQFRSEGTSLAKAISRTIQSVTEQDMKNGVSLSDQQITGSDLQTILFDDKLTVIPESEQIAQARIKDDPAYAQAKQVLHDGTEIPMWQYELKYTSAFDAYTDYRWQGIIDSFVQNETVVFAIPTFYSSNPKAAGYIPTHNTVFSPTGEASKDKWKTEGLLSQKYRANRVFNDKTGYLAASYKETKEALVQMYPRIIEGKTVMMWDISYPLIFNGKHWGAIRVAMSKENADNLIAHERKQLLYQFSLMFLAVMALLLILTRVLVQRRLAKLTASTQTIFASGTVDLTQQFDDTGKDEIATLSHELNRLLAVMRDMVRSINGMSMEVSQSSGTLSKAAQQTGTAAGAFHMTIQTMNEGAKRQAQGAREGATAMEEMAVGIQRVAESSSSIAEATQGLVLQVLKSSGNLGSITGQMNVVRDTTFSTTESVQKLDDMAKEIGAFATFITNISNQTNILSLNASIEAARSGEHGKGFSVIANEIRQLAVQSKEFSSKITEMIAEIQNYTGRTVNDMQKNAEEIAASVDQVHHIAQSLKVMEGAAAEVDGNIQEVSAVSQQMSAGAEEITASISDMSAIAAESSEHIDSAVLQYEEQLRIIEHISKTSETLNGLAIELQQKIQMFKW